jgi:hypothetical protein
MDVAAPSSLQPQTCMRSGLKQQPCMARYGLGYRPANDVSGVLGVFGACRKRETLTGDATIRYFDYLDGFDTFDGLLANLFSGDCWPADGWLLGWQVPLGVVPPASSAFGCRPSKSTPAASAASLSSGMGSCAGAPASSTQLTAACCIHICCLQRSLLARSAALQQLTLWTHPGWWTGT